MEAMLTE